MCFWFRFLSICDGYGCDGVLRWLEVEEEATPLLLFFLSFFMFCLCVRWFRFLLVYDDSGLLLWLGCWLCYGEVIVYVLLIFGY
jgi:hypothetical protein